MKVCIIAGNSAYREMFEAHGWEVMDNAKNADLVCFTGGADVSPELYGQKNVASYVDKKRDDYEEGLFNAYVGHVPMVGICRGGQFLNVMCGGSMWQDVDGHATYGGHIMTDLRTGYDILVSSTHHQMMRYGEGGVVLATAHEAKSFRDDDGLLTYRDDSIHEDLEVVLYPKQNVLCFQPHPEFKGFAECTKAFFEYLKRILPNRFAQ